MSLVSLAGVGVGVLPVRAWEWKKKGLVGRMIPLVAVIGAVSFGNVQHATGDEARWMCFVTVISTLTSSMHLFP
jgi:hypothetical protein